MGEALIPPSSSTGRRSTGYATHLTGSARRCKKVLPLTRGAGRAEHTWGKPCSRPAAVAADEAQATPPTLPAAPVGA
ncbi:hypothetical protein NDU88_002559 [Pleurodeles waltl]|uniref:Uncharacterized protein n=1 Tax=Pleurodeles waltl TaxID=8319 RepID=A0AAV7W3N8_PLEWA|nr:hypothetical protein NDU88_002559 [Pleurodeles waltl]